MKRLDRLTVTSNSKKQALINKALCDYFGHDKWSIQDLRNRCVSKQEDGVERFYIDSTLILSVFKMVVTLEDGKLTGTRHWRTHDDSGDITVTD